MNKFKTSLEFKILEKKYIILQTKIKKPWKNEAHATKNWEKWASRKKKDFI